MVLFRHATAEDKYDFHVSSNGAPDSKRPLSASGLEQMKTVSKGLYKALDGNMQRIVSSPYIRAIQTAQTLLETISENTRPDLEISDLLTPGASFETVRRWLKGETRTTIVVGHEPDMSWLMQQFTGSGEIRVKFKPTSACLIEFEGPLEDSSGQLHWFLNPTLLHRLGNS